MYPSKKMHTSVYTDRNKKITWSGALDEIVGGMMRDKTGRIHGFNFFSRFYPWTK
jgi:hypothetical protein